MNYSEKDIIKINELTNLIGDYLSEFDALTESDAKSKKGNAINKKIESARKKLRIIKLKYVKLDDPNINELVKADEIHVKAHPSKQDEEELVEDKTKQKLLKYIDSKWFDEPEYIKLKKIKLLRNRVIKKINSGEFMHKKEVNKYIKAYNVKNFNSDKYI